MDFNYIKFTIFSFYGLSIMLDHLTTRIGISRIDLVESNPLTLLLMERGAWLYVDAAIFVGLIYTTHHLMGRSRNENKLFLLFPLVTGIVRLVAGVSNLMLFI